MIKVRLLPVVIAGILGSWLLEGCASSQKAAVLSKNQDLDYTVVQARKAIGEDFAVDKTPRRINKGQVNWELVKISDWTSGFWPGTLWYVYEYTGDKYWKEQAQKYSAGLVPMLDDNYHDHDLGFQFYCSLGNGYRLTGSSEYKEVLLRAADSLADMYNPNVGTILSWPWARKREGWPHNTIVDNMMNLELLFWAAKNGGGQKMYDIAVKHAETTMKNHFRPDWSTYHVAVYDDKTGKFIKGVTHQGFSHQSMWARGQAWAIYGYTVAYRETRKEEFLRTAQEAANIFLRNLPKDKVPYWDFNAPGVVNGTAPRDASAAAITASALIELSGLVKDAERGKEYLADAEAILKSLSSDKYQSKEVNHAFLLHSTGHHPGGYEIDASINYADYYYIEALIRLQKSKGLVMK